MAIVFLLALAISIYCVVDIVQKPDAAWEGSGQNKVLWIVLVLVLGVIGSAVYWFAIRPKVVQAAA